MTSDINVAQSVYKALSFLKYYITLYLGYFLKATEIFEKLDPKYWKL